VYCQRNNQSEPEPAAFFAAREQTLGLELIKVVEVRESHAPQRITFERTSYADLVLTFP
jgi:hypothetical protein